MKFPVTGRKYYRLTITTTPTVSAWSASFDGGLNWVVGTAEGSNVFSWLLDTPSTIGGHIGGATQVTAVPGQVTAVKLQASTGSELLILNVPDDCNVEWT